MNLEIRDMIHSSRFTQYAIRNTQYEHLFSTTVENPLQINLFMQNKPNFRKSQMNANSRITMNYKNFIPLAGYKNKPNSNPIKPNCRKAKMNANVFVTKDYRKKDDFSVRINKPNFFKGPK